MHHPPTGFLRFQEGVVCPGNRPYKNASQLAIELGLGDLKVRAVAQYDVLENLGPMLATVPMAVVQSSLFDGYKRRVVVPLVVMSVFPRYRNPPDRQNHLFDILDQQLVLNPLNMVSVKLDALGPVVANQGDAGQRIADALDELLTSACG